MPTGKDFVIISNTKETSTVLSIMSKEVRKGTKICLEKEEKCLCCQHTYEKHLHGVMQDSKDLELKTAFRGCASSLKVFNI